MFAKVTLTSGDRSCTVDAMLDTGASQSFVSSDVARRLGNPDRIAAGWLYGVGGAVEATAIHVQANLPDGPTCTLRASVLDIGFTCVLGLDFMRQSEVTIHVADERITYSKKRKVA